MHGWQAPPAERRTEITQRRPRDAQTPTVAASDSLGSWVGPGAVAQPTPSVITPPSPALARRTALGALFQRHIRWDRSAPRRRVRRSRVRASGRRRTDSPAPARRARWRCCATELARSLGLPAALLPLTSTSRVLCRSGSAAGRSPPAAPRDADRRRTGPAAPGLHDHEFVVLEPVAVFLQQFSLATTSMASLLSSGGTAPGHPAQTADHHAGR